LESSNVSGNWLNSQGSIPGMGEILLFRRVPEFFLEEKEAGT
jgi:hypothetical protein